MFLLLVIYCCNKASNRIVTRSKELVFYSWIPLSPEVSRLSPFTYSQQYTRTSRTFYTFAVHQPKPPTIITLHLGGAWLLVTRRSSRSRILCTPGSPLGPIGPGSPFGPTGPIIPHGPTGPGLPLWPLSLAEVKLLSFSSSESTPLPGFGPLSPLGSLGLSPPPLLPGAPALPPVP